ncbi:T9SS C-terminal target domain-containing protein [Cytophaga aurantiaca]|uniref:T9SS C-terminal target domain-containing protein n=1 Tax=Cytophaga aurantiaca TaxID=29530 RepID=UPI00037303F2|nr:T9SS C-terminal target domain-containing protein [Cytophaga aurantiaca]
MITYLKNLFLGTIFLFSLDAFSQVADITKGCAPLKVNFTAPATSTTYFWDFKDGVTSNLQNPANIFGKAGIYDVVFKETIGGPIIKTIRIEVFPEPVLNITATSGCYPLNGQYKNASTISSQIAITNYTWVFADGTSQSGPNLSSINRSYTSKGDYGVSFGIETQYPSCNKAGSFNGILHVYDPPVASFTTTPATPISCNPTLTVGFINNSTGALPLSYSWNLGNGQLSTALNPPSQTYTTNSYNATLSVKFTANLAGCDNTTSKTISVGKPVVKIKKYADTVCLTGLASFKSLTAGVPTWTTDANAAIKSIVNDSVSISFTKGGLHTITLKVTSPDGQCFDQTTTTVYVDDIQGSIQHTPTYSCTSPMNVQYTAVSNQTNVSYEWQFADTQKSTLNKVTKTFKSATAGITYSINDFEPLLTQLTITSKKTGCKISAIALDTMWLPNARMMPDVTKGCSPLTVTFSDSSKSNDPIVSWKWLYGDNATQSGTTKAPVTHTYTQAGEYQSKLVVTTKRGCIDTSYAIVIEVGNKIANLDFSTATPTTCCDQAVTFNAIVPPAAQTLIDGYHFYTDKNTSFHCSDQNSFKWTYSSPGLQDVSLMVDYNGCFTTVSKPAYVTVKGSSPKINYGAACTSPLEYTFNDQNFSGPETYTWDFGDGTTATTGAKPKHTYAASGDYLVKVIGVVTTSGCAPIERSKTVHVRKLKADFKGDSILCSGVQYPFDAITSVDEYQWPHNGYDWHIAGAPNNVRTGTALSLFSFSPGTHPITLYVKDINGCVDSLTKKVKVFGMTPKFTADHIQICNPSTVKFTEASIGDTTLIGWDWNFHDGTSGFSTQQNPSYTFAKAADATNKYSITLTVTDQLGCTDTINKKIDFYKPKSKITPSKYYVCVNEPVTIAASDYTAGGSNLTYNWNFGNATTATLQSNSVKYTTDGTYKVLLNYEEASTGCKGLTDSINISVQSYPTASFKTNVDTVTIICAPKIVSLADNSTSKYAYSNYWDFGNGQTSTQANFSLIYKKGIYTVKHITTTTNGCADTTSRSFQLHSPEGDFVIDKNTICKGEVITFKIKDTSDVSSFAWAFGDGIVVDETSPVTHQYNFHPPQGQTLAKLSLIGNEGCNAIVEKAIKIHEVIADFDRLDGIDSTSCFNDGPYKLTNTSKSASTFWWDFGDGQTSNTQNINTHAYATPGTYDVTLAVDNQGLGCVDTITKTIIIYQNPTLVAIGDTVCQVAGSVALNVLNPTATSTYEWTPSTGLSSTTSTNPIATIQHSVQYKVVETDLNGCTDKNNVPAIVIESIGLRSLDTSIVIGDVIPLPVNGQPYYKYLWTPTAGLSCLTCNYPTVQPLEDIIYTLNVKDRRDCYNENYTYNIKIKPETFVKFPTMFTPNGDGNNDVIFVKGWGIKDLLEFQIFNRWGQLIYSNTNINDGWDGTFNGILQNTDIYVYKVKVLTWKNVEIKEEGYINLVR